MYDGLCSSVLVTALAHLDSQTGSVDSNGLAAWC